MASTPLINTHVHAGDIVKVISGNHRGSEGKILQVNRAKCQVVIEGVRMIKKHVRRSQDQPNGAIIEREGPLHISNVKLIEKGTRAVAESKGGKQGKIAGEAKTPKAKTTTPSKRSKTPKADK